MSETRDSRVLQELETVVKELKWANILKLSQAPYVSRASLLFDLLLFECTFEFSQIRFQLRRLEDTRLASYFSVYFLFWLFILDMKIKAGTCQLLFVLVTCLGTAVCSDFSSLIQTPLCVEILWKQPIFSVANLRQTGCVASSCPDLTSSDYTHVSVPQFWVC